MKASDGRSEPFTESGKLDLIRSLAVLFVVLSHLPITQQIANYTFGSNKINVQPMGLVGVGVFFVHTCFVLMLSLNRQTTQLGTTGSAITFYIRRVFRIYPLSVVTVLVLAVTSYLSENAKIDHSQLVSNLFLVQNITGDPSIPAPLWSLPYEVQMYLFLPAFFLLVSRHPLKSPALLTSMWILCIALVFSIHAMGLNYHLVKYFPAFIPGVLAYSLTSRAVTSSKFPAYTPALYIIFAAAAFPVFVAYDLKENILLWPTCLLLGIIIPYSKEIQSNFIKNSTAIIAKYSYGIYLVHAPMIIFSFGYLHDSLVIVQWTAFSFGTAGISYLAFRLIENPGIQLGKRVADSIRNSQRVRPGSLKFDVPD